MKISQKFNDLEEKREKAFIGYVCAGDPDVQSSLKTIQVMSKYADIIELGIPFSDPIADGKTIQKASERALKAGMNTDKFFEMCAEIKNTVIVAMTYYNILFQYGLEKFVKKCRETGVEGIIIPDLPVEESQELLNLCKKYEINLIFLVSETSTQERIEKIVRTSTGYLYLISLLGVTGEREKIEVKKDFIERVRREVEKQNKKLPLCVGFGISKPEQVKKILESADGVIIGSAIINRSYNLEELEEFLKAMKNATKY